MKRLLKITVVALAFVAVSAFANSNNSQGSSDVYSLIGIEGGYNSSSVNHFGSSSKAVNFSHVGLKLGAQTQSYRLFLNLRGYMSSDFKNTSSFGIEGQYMFAHFKVLDLFLGAGAGMMYMTTKESSFSFDHSYYSGEAGLNFHIAPMFDLAVGGRYMKLGYKGGNTQVYVDIDHIATIYTSLVYKFKMN
jgi:hypothetical protein